MAKWTEKYFGEFVAITQSPYSALGIGKLVGVEGNIASVQFFDAPGATLPEIVKVDEKFLSSSKLPAQTRVYMQGVGGRWQVGRVLEDDRSSIFVQFPNQETANISAESLQVRWNKPLTDPLSLLIAEATETPFLADARSLFSSSVAKQYQATNGTSALLSSSIDLVDYQFDVVRRVLLDPVQRYLLADEVGLGKTIEASVILRQYFIDEVGANAVVIVPPALVSQWRKELIARFGMAPHLDDKLFVVAHNDLETLNSVIHDAGMLIVDEAHHLSRQSTRDQQKLYDIVRTQAKRVQRLLLLSATPVLGNAEEFLRVLHLLDPVVFPLEDLEGFKKRISSRQVVAEVVSTLLPSNVWGLGPDLDRLLENYADDSLLVEKVNALKKVLDTFPDEENEEFLQTLEDLKSHLVESYRLHRRILRNRRASFSWATPRRSEMREVIFAGSSTPIWRERLEALRLSIASHEDLPEEVFQALLQVAVQPSSIPSLMEHFTSIGINNAEILEQARSVDLAGSKVKKDERKIHALSHQILKSLEGKGIQVVVFCDRKLDADIVFEELKSSVGEHHVARHSPPEEDIDDDVPFPWERFLSEPEQIRVLVCDVRAEEGVNLHGGRKIAFHFDLPASPNRIEQRLGRLDRYGVGDPIVSYVMLDEANADEIAWASVLNDGWGVFSQSVASLQYLIEATSGPLAKEWIEQGTLALQNQAKLLGGEDGLVQKEVRQLNHQDSLDSMGNREILGMDALEDEDSDWVEWRAAFKALAIDVLQFQWRSEVDSGMSNVDNPFRVGYVYRDSGRSTLVPMTGFFKHFLNSVDQKATGRSKNMALTHRYAFKRQTVTNRRGQAQGSRLLRIGDPLVTSLEQFCANDDRGRAFAVWRVDRQYEVSDPSGADLFFRFDFIVRPSLPNMVVDEGCDQTSLEQRMYTQTLARKSSTFLPPLSLRVWVQGNGEIIVDPSEFLTGEYSDSWKGTRRDFNLNIRRWRSLPSDIKSTWMRDWSGLCESQRQLAIETVHQLPQFQSHLQVAIQACNRERRLRRSQGEARASRLTGVAKTQELDELRKAEAMYIELEAAIAKPRLDLDVVGAVFLAADSPFTE